MTDYEMLSTVIEIVNALWAIFATYVSIVFAFLVASYLVADKLAPKIVSIVITLYTLVALWSVFGLNRISATASGMAFEIKRAVLEAGSSLGWHPIVGTPDQLFSAIPVFVTTVALVAYVGSIVFFFHQRKFHLTA